MAKFLEVTDEPITKTQAVRSSISQFSDLCKRLDVDPAILTKPERDLVLAKAEDAKTTKGVKIGLLNGLLEISKNDPELSTRIKDELDRTRKVPFAKRLAMAGQIVADFNKELENHGIKIPPEVGSEAGNKAVGLNYEDEIKKGVTQVIFDYLFKENPVVAAAIAKKLDYKHGQA